MLSAARLWRWPDSSGQRSPASTEGSGGGRPVEVGDDDGRRDRMAGLDGQPAAPSLRSHDVGLSCSVGRVRRLPRRSAPIAITFLAVAGLAAGIAFAGLPAVGVGAIGVGVLVTVTFAVGAPAVLIAEGAVSVVVGLMVGASRHQYVERTFQAEQLLAERVRADAERDRAAALAERNRIGREVHDVLAHRLGPYRSSWTPPTRSGKRRQLVEGAPAGPTSSSARRPGAGGDTPGGARAA